MKIVAEEGNDTQISIEAGEYLWIDTPKGKIMVYIGEGSYNAITTWVHDTHMVGFYTKKTQKRTSPCNEDVDLVSIKPKEETE